MPLNSHNSSDSLERWTRQQIDLDRFDRRPHPQFRVRVFSALILTGLFLVLWAANLLPSNIAPLVLLLCSFEIITYPLYLYFFRKYPTRRKLQSYCHWIIDILIITWAIHFLGGRQAFLFSFAYSLVILSSSMIAQRRDSFILAGISALCYWGMLLLEASGIIHFHQIWSFELSLREQLG